MSDFEKFKSAIFNQESGNGKDPRSKTPNYAGALGDGQILESTFKGLQRDGKVPAEYQWENPQHNRFASEKYMEEAWSATKGDARRAAAYYYGGPKAVLGGGIKEYRDLKNDKAPTTIQYADKIAQRMGLAAATAPTPLGVRGYTATEFAASVPDNSVKRQLAQEASALKEELRPDLLARFSAAVGGNQDQRIASIVSNWRKEWPREEGFEHPRDKLLGKETDDVVALLKTGSQTEFDHVLSEQESNAARLRTVMTGGAASGIALSFGSEFLAVSNWVAPWAAARAFGGHSLRLAEEGRKAAAFGTAAVENVVAGTALELGMQTAEGRYDPANLLLAATVDMIAGGVQTASLVRGARLRTAAETVLRKELEIDSKVTQSLGPQASPEMRAAEYQRLRAAELREPFTTAHTPLPQTRQLMDRPDDGVTTPETPPTGGQVVPGQTPGLALPGDSAYKRETAGYPSTGAASTTGSNVQAPDTPEFKEWFGNSAVVREDGSARVVYHLTNADIKSFDKGFLGSNTGAASSREGFFFAGNPATTNAYARPDQGTPNVLPVFLSLKNPLVFDMGGSSERKRTYASLLREAKEKGHDGLIVKNTVDGGPVDDIFVMFDPTQAKSAIGNSGRYSKDDPDLAADRSSEGGSPAAHSLRLSSLEQVDEAFGRQTRWENAEVTQNRILQAGRNGGENAYGQAFATMSDGEFKNYQSLLDLPKGFHLTKTAAANPNLSRVNPGMAKLVAEYLPNSTVVLGRTVTKAGNRGEALSVGNVHMLASDPNSPYLDSTTFHEFGHAVVSQHLKDMPDILIDAINREYLDFANTALSGAPEARAMRFSGGNPGSREGVLPVSAYNLKRDEWIVENFVKHLQQRIAKNEPGLDRGMVARLIDGIKSMFAMFMKAKKDGVINPAESVEAFARAVLARNSGPVKGKATADSGPVTQASTPEVNSFLTNPVALKYGLNLLPVGTEAERATAKAMLNLRKKADDWEVKHPMDADWVKRADQLIDNSLLPAASTGLRLLKSPDPLARMIASELLEDASGVAGTRNSTAAISKYLHEGHFLGNTLVDVTNAYEIWASKRGGGLLSELTDGGKLRSKFNYEVASEIEARRSQQTASITTDQEVKLAADSLQGAYDRIRVAQRDNKTLGYQALWDNSLGYMPHKISPNKWLSLSNGQKQTVHQALTDQFITIEGWDMSFADGLASRYLQRVQARATGGHDSPIGGASAGSAEIVEDALLAAGMSKDEVRNNMQRFNRGAATWTKSRLDLDLNKVYDVDGEPFKLLDVFDTDHTALLRSQAGRASGEVALARHGVYGRPGLQLIRDTLAAGGPRADSARFNRELDALDQVSAEFMNSPFGTAEPKWMENARILNSVVRLGGMVYNQFAEFVNGVNAVGVSAVLSSVGSMGRLRGEVKALVRGEKVDNAWLASIEKLGGREFGTDSYKIVMPFDSPDHAYPTYGRDTLSNMDKLLRGASYAQAKLSLWRTVSSVQQRGMAEQIVAKIARYSRDGKEDVALRQFGISPELQAAIVKDGVAKFDGDSLVEFDVTKLQDAALREDLIQATHRGVRQIIQGTFIGETGKWAHEGYLKMLTQFRTFSLTSMEKQWARQRNSRGVAKSMGIMLGSMGVVIPVYVARVYAQSVGREDREAFLEERLAPEVIARQTLNYIAMAGLAGDFLDAAATLAPEGLGVKKMGGGRAGADTEFVGNLIAPSLSLVDDGWKALQNLDDPEKLAKLLPGSRLPYVLPAINALGD